MQDIKEFRIGTANYTLENAKGSRLRLVLNYAKDTSRFIILKDLGNVGRLKKQAKAVAGNLLGKKAERNLAYKLKKLKVS